MSLARVTQTLHLLAAGVCLVVLTYVVSRHDAPMNTVQWTVFYGLPVAALIFFLWAARAGAETRANLLLLLLSVGAAVLLVEVGLSLRPPPEQFDGVAAAVGSPDSRTKFGVVRELREAGETAFPAVSPWAVRPWVEDDDLLPVTTAPAGAAIVTCDEGAGWLEYVADPFGFRSARLSPPGTETAIALVGDSFTFGQCVADEETIPGNLAARYPGVRNLGVSGSGPLHQLAVLREYGPIFRPDLVLWVFYEGNDWGDLYEESQWPALTAYLSDDHRQGVAERQTEVDEWLADALNEVYDAEVSAEDRGGPSTVAPAGGAGVSLRTVLTLARLRGLLNFGIELPTDDPLGTLPDVLEAGVRTARAWGGEVVLVYLPEYRRYRPLGDQLVTGKDAFLTLEDSLGLEVIDLAEVFSSTVEDPTTLWAHPRGHLNARGYDVAADAIARRIEARVP